MSAEAMRWAKRQKIAAPSMKAVLLALAYLHKDGADIFPSQQHLSEATSLSVRTVRDALAKLEHFGLVTRSARSRGRKGRTSDLVTLALKSEFTLTRHVIAGTKPKSKVTGSNRKSLPVVENLQPANLSVPTGEDCRGIGEEQKKELSQEEGSHRGGDRHRLGEPPGWTPMLIAGGRS